MGAPALQACRKNGNAAWAGGITLTIVRLKTGRRDSGAPPTWGACSWGFHGTSIPRQYRAENTQTVERRRRSHVAVETSEFLLFGRLIDKPKIVADAVADAVQLPVRSHVASSTWPQHRHDSIWSIYKERLRRTVVWFIDRPYFCKIDNIYVAVQFRTEYMKLPPPMRAPAPRKYALSLGASNGSCAHTG